MSAPTRILIADDDVELLDVLSYLLARHGYQPVPASDGDQALARWKSDRPTLVLLDVVMPRRSGFDVLREIRRHSPVPVIMLTARGSDSDIVRGLKLGADDYVTKPFSVRQLVARIDAVLRRRQGSDGLAARQLAVGGFVLDLDSNEVRREAQVAHLTPLEASILHKLALNYGRVVSTRRLLDEVWGYEDGDPGMIKVHVSHIRRKLEAIGATNDVIRATSGVGYCLTVRESLAEEQPVGS